jgi:acyl carrier protein
MGVAFEEFAKELAAIVEEGVGEISPERELLSIPLWDSLAIVNVMAVVSDKFDCILDPEQLAAATTVKDLYALLGR